MTHIAIIGNGISGISAARHIRKLNKSFRITVISAETDHFFSRTALMYIYMGHMKYENTKPYEDWFWKENRIDLMRGYVSKVNTDGKQLEFSDGKTLAYDKLIIACGSKPNKFGWPGQDLDGVQGLYSYQDLELLEKNTHAYGAKEKKVHRAVLVGGGLIGVELAEMLHTRDIEVTFLVREGRFWGNVLPKEEGEIVSRHMLEHHVDLRLNNELQEILPDENGRVRAIITKAGEEIPCQFVGLTAGVSPNIEFLKDSAIETQRGVMVNEYLETNIPDVYAIGDCANFHEHPTGRRPIEQVWYTGRMMGETVARTICGNRLAYKPGIWFNSAKFFDIEYQTYGTVLPNPGDDKGVFYWEHANGKICIKMVYEKDTMALFGINVFGMRLRHKVCDRWLVEKRSLEYALEHLRDANFDPEFFKPLEADIIAHYNATHGKNLKPKKRSWARIFTKAPQPAG